MARTFGERVRDARKQKRMSQKDLARLSGIKQSTISYIERGRNKSTTAITSLARALDRHALWLEKGIGPESLEMGLSESEESGEYISVRLATIKLSAGVSGYAIDFHNDDAAPLFFKASWFTDRGFHPARLIALRVSGASMEPGLYDADIVVVNLASTRQLDGEVYALNYEGELVIKRLKRDAGEWWIVSDNHDKRRFPDKRVSDGVQIIGQIVYKSSERI